MPTNRRVRPKRTKCKTGKVRYYDSIAAKMALANAQHKDGSRRAKIETRVYHCPECKGWHLTSQPLRVKQVT